jgi:chromosome partitioning protein
MKIISITTQKGGAGKTTLATNLAVAAAQNGDITLLLDADSRQLTALEWYKRRENKENPIVIEIQDQAALDKMITAAKGKGVDTIIIDTQGAQTNLTNHVMSISDFCLVPCKSGGFDIGAQRSTAMTLQKLKKDAAFVITQAPSRGQEVVETKTILNGLGLAIYKEQISLLKAYKDAALFSSSVIEDGKDNKAIAEIKTLYGWTLKQIKSLNTAKELQEVANG